MLQKCCVVFGVANVAVQEGDATAREVILLLFWIVVLFLAYGC